MKKYCFLFLILACLYATPMFASNQISEQLQINPIVLVIGLTSLSIIPFFIIMTTSFLKLVIVFSVLRAALGNQQIPPNIIVTGLSLIITIYIMFPVGVRIHEDLLSDSTIVENISKKDDLSYWIHIIQKAKIPIQDFLLKNIHDQEHSFFYHLANEKISASDDEKREIISPNDMIILIPSFVISELKEAFEIGFLIFLPFIVIDMVIANILQAMGMMMLSPTTISLPFKLLLFVMADGWSLVIKGLIKGYL